MSISTEFLTRLNIKETTKSSLQEHNGMALKQMVNTRVFTSRW